MRAAPILLALAVAGCGGEQQQQQQPATAAPPPPDAGRALGHGRDATHVTVPGEDRTPPQAVVTLGARAEAAMPGGEAPAPVRLERPRVPARTTGRDYESGVARVRISFREVTTCRGGDETFRRPRIRYLPPPQVERIRSAPGARLRTERRRARTLALTGCGRRATVEAVHGELWGEAINGLGLEAVTPHIRFSYRPRAPRSGRR